MPKSAKERVAESAAALDRVVPDWVTKITKPLNTKSVDTCVLGQVYGVYFTGRRKLQDAGIPSGQLDGFLTAVRPFQFMENMDANALQREWGKAIAARRANTPVAEAA